MSFLKKILAFTVLLIFSCNEKEVKKTSSHHSKNKTEKIVDAAKSKMPEEAKNHSFEKIINSIELKKTPIIDTTNFDNFHKTNFLNQAEISALQLEKIYPNFFKKGYNYKTTPSYKIELLEDFHTIVLTTYKGDHELESVLVNYDFDGKMIDYKIIAYDEIAEGMSRIESKIEKNKLTITHILWADKKLEEIQFFELNTNGRINPGFDSDENYFFINAENGLNVREASDLSSKKIAKIPYGVRVEKIADTNKELVINDNGKSIKGKWIKIRFYNYLYQVLKDADKYDGEGYVFDGFLKSFKNYDVIENSKIDKEEYLKLLTKAAKKKNPPKKISNLDSIKMILKNRVEWVTEFEEEEYQRDDKIKSITTKRGEQLFLNRNNDDYSFSEGAPGYYPEYDILVLDAGHSSDMSILIATGETDLTIGSPEYIISSPNNKYRLNGAYGGQECFSYFFQKKENGRFIFLTEFNMDFGNCAFKAFHWISDDEFIYIKEDYGVDDLDGEHFKGKIKNQKR